MSAFLAGVGAKLADRWVQFLMLPGLLWTGALAAGSHLGQSHPFAVMNLSHWIDALASKPAAHAPGTVVLTAAGVLLAGFGIGLLAVGLGGLVERIWAMPGERPPGTWLVRLRHHRWQNTKDQFKNAILAAVAAESPATAPAAANAVIPPDLARTQTQVRILVRRRHRLGAEPWRPTRVAERFERTIARARAVNGLDDLPSVWPRLWTVLPTELRSDITAARGAYDASARLTAWGLLYALIGLVWWPAILISTAVLVTAGSRARDAASALADLIESAVDLRIKDLAEQLGTPVSGDPVEIGRALSARLCAGELLPARPRRV
ncbi:hypothetical protein [Catenulispora pinisilvae]|uniref:hypothetical protein n=1 Tax=Catenulispora pinisilvae TaxID=2705253 RepID=UPI0018922361|nr:hypothetical protein [Catenulispora pinisilvae]